MTELELIYSTIIASIPALASILGVITASLTVIHKFKNLVKSGKDKNKLLEDQNEMLKIALNASIEESNELKKTQKKLLAKLEHIDENDLEV